MDLPGDMPGKEATLLCAWVTVSLSQHRVRGSLDSGQRRVDCVCEVGGNAKLREGTHLLRQVQHPPGSRHGGVNSLAVFQ